MSGTFHHLTLSERIEIERMLSVSYTAKRIASKLGYSRTTISREVKRGVTADGRAKAYGRHWNGCVYQRRCALTGVCGNEWCKRRCASCRHTNCTRSCSEFTMDICPRTLRWPHCCNGCPEYKSCAAPRYLYKASVADARAQELLVTSREGHDLTEDELAQIARLAAPMLEGRLSPAVIWSAHGDAMPCSERTFYRLVHDRSLEGICAMDLPFAVRYRPRKGFSHASRPNIKAELLEGRTYTDFCALDAEAQAYAVEMDCVCGLVTDTRALLTLFWRSLAFQLAILLDAHDSESVIRELDFLERVLMEDFPSVLLADRGTEFSQVELIERAAYLYTLDGLRTSLFFCDPRRSDQKGRCENAHRLIRRVLPKGSVSLDDLDETQIALMNSHVNSMPRTSLGGASPMSLAQRHLPEQFFADYHLKLIRPEDIILKPHLLGIC
jgi:IS30 family transposase